MYILWWWIRWWRAYDHWDCNRDDCDTMFVPSIALRSWSNCVVFCTARDPSRLAVVCAETTQPQKPKSYYPTIITPTQLTTHFKSYSDVPCSNLNVGGNAGNRSSSSAKARPWLRTCTNWSIAISSSSRSAFTISRISAGSASLAMRKFKSPNQNT